MHRLDYDRHIFDLHVGGKIAVSPRVDLSDPQLLADVYTPGRGTGLHRHRERPGDG